MEGITSREAERSKNFCALGLMCWLYHRPTEGTLAFIEEKFGKSPRSWRRTRRRSRRATTTARHPRTSPSRTRSHPRSSRPGGTGRSPATPPSPTASSPPRGRRSCRSSSAHTRSRPASAILEELARHKSFGVTTFQAEDEIAACGAALGASFGGALGVTTSAGPGHRAQGRDGRARHHARAAAAHPRHPARRPLDRDADEARAGRSADGAVRPQRRDRPCR